MRSRRGGGGRRKEEEEDWAPDLFTSRHSYCHIEEHYLQPHLPIMTLNPSLNQTCFF